MLLYFLICLLIVSTILVAWILLDASTTSTTKIKLPASIANKFMPGFTIVGGQARLALYCLVNNREYPSCYTPRDLDVLLLVGEKPGAEGIDWIGEFNSIEHYFSLIDLITNQVAVKDGYLITTPEAIKCFKEGRTMINKGCASLKNNPGVATYEYLLLRAAIQTGWCILENRYYPRAGAVKLSKRQLTYLKEIGDYHWYWPTYRHKMEQVKLKKH